MTQCNFLWSRIDGLSVGQIGPGTGTIDPSIYLPTLVCLFLHCTCSEPELFPQMLCQMIAWFSFFAWGHCSKYAPVVSHPSWRARGLQYYQKEATDAHCPCSHCALAVLTGHTMSWLQCGQVCLAEWRCFHTHHTLCKIHVYPVGFQQTSCCPGLWGSLVLTGPYVLLLECYCKSQTGEGLLMLLDQCHRPSSCHTM